MRKYTNPYFIPSPSQLPTPNVGEPDFDSLRNYSNSLGQQKGIGANYGNIANGVIGGIGLLGNAYGMSRQRFNFNTNVAPSQTDSTMAPSYTGGELASEINGAHPQGATGGEVLSGAAEGAAAGAEVGGPAGAVVGGVVGAASSLIGGESRADAQRRELEQARQRLRAIQNQYNQQDVSYRNYQNQMSDYYRRNNPAVGEYNVNRSRFNY